ncbi:MAG: Ig-like domain-containing domain, partial [Planctomycetota bacterium]
MRLRPLTILTALLIGLLLPGCSGGGGGGARTAAALCVGDSTFCVIGCNLSCSVAGSCGVTEIAQNQTIEIELSNEIDPSTVNAASVSLRTAAGERPAGRFLISGRRLTFIPEVIVNGASTSFGFKEG